MFVAYEKLNILFFLKRLTSLILYSSKGVTGATKTIASNWETGLPTLWLSSAIAIGGHSGLDSYVFGARDLHSCRRSTTRVRDYLDVGHSTFNSQALAPAFGSAIHSDSDRML